MNVQYAFYGIFVSLVSLGFWYYIGLFCGIYLSSSYGWIKGTFTSLSISWLGFGLFVPLIMSVIRSIIKCCPDLRYYIYIYQSCLTSILFAIEFIKLIL